MWSQPRIKLAAWAVLPALILPTLLAGCSDIYFDRRETVASGADDHIAANEVVQMIDPWPPAAGRRNIAFDGTKMQSAVERYRTGRVYPPVNATTSSVAYDQAQQNAAAASGATGATASSAPAAPVK
jgi:hypothetical protein